MTSDAEPSMEVRIAQRMTIDGSVVIPPRVALWLEKNANLTAERRSRIRDTDPEAYIALVALHLAACNSESGTKDVARQSVTAQLHQWVSSREAADTLNVTDRCIRNWCTSGRLHARHVGARWLVDPASLDIERRRTP